MVSVDRGTSLPKRNSLDCLKGEMVAHIRILVLMLFLFQINETRAMPSDSGGNTSRREKPMPRSSGVVESTNNYNQQGCPLGFPCARTNEQPPEISCSLGSRCSRKVAIKRIIDAFAVKSPCPSWDDGCQEKRTAKRNYHRCSTGQRYKTRRNRVKKSILQGTGTKVPAITTRNGDRLPGAGFSNVKKREDGWGKSVGSSSGHAPRAAGSVERPEAPLQDHSSNKLSPGADTLASSGNTNHYHSGDICQTGTQTYWCKIKAELGYQNSLTNDGMSTNLQDNSMNQLQKHCPIDLLCSFKRENGYENSESFKQCPPGLWCKRDRIANEANVDTTMDPDDLKQRCPTGLWCSRKSKLGYENFKRMEQCPPGLWCKRNGMQNEDETFNFKENEPNEPMESSECAPGLACSPKRQLGYENSETIDNCPPGLWCKRNGVESYGDSSDFKEKKTNELRGGDCPNGLLCSPKRDLGHENSETMNNCPPGLWCKRNGIESEDGSINFKRNVANETREGESEVQSKDIFTD